MSITDVCVEQSIITFFKDHLNVDVPSVQHSLIEAGVLDSLMIVDLVLYMEQTFDVSPSLEDLEIENFETVASMAAFVAARRARRPLANPNDRQPRSSAA